MRQRDPTCPQPGFWHTLACSSTAVDGADLSERAMDDVVTPLPPLSPRPRSGCVLCTGIKHAADRPSFSNDNTAQSEKTRGRPESCNRRDRILERANGSGSQEEIALEKSAWKSSQLVPTFNSQLGRELSHWKPPPRIRRRRGIWKKGIRATSGAGVVWRFQNRSSITVSMAWLEQWTCQPADWVETWADGIGAKFVNNDNGCLFITRSQER